MLTRRTVLLAKTETTYGTDATPTTTSNALLVSEPTIKITGEVLDRDYLRDSLSPMAPIIGMKEAEIDFVTELKGSGAAGVAPIIGVLFKGCGMAETITTSASVTYAPQSNEANVGSLTIYFYRDGNLHKLTGARGSFALTLEAGKYAKLKFNFKGLYNAVSASACPSVTISESTAPVPVYGTSTTWGTYSPIASNLSVEYGNEITRIESINAAAGVDSFRISARKPQGKMSLAAIVEATHPVWADWASSTVRALVSTLGAVAGNIVTISAPKCVPTSVDYGDDAGVTTYDLPFLLTKNADAGDDELKITLT